MKKFYNEDLIVAIATAVGGGVGIIRISVKDRKNLQNLVENITKSRLNLENLQQRFCYFSQFVDSKNNILDSGLLVYFAAPNSFTGEEVVELHGHGGKIVCQMLLNRCLELGARLANPGEFSQRAFFNEKINLLQAEAIADLVAASTSKAVQSANKSLNGEFSDKINAISEKLTQLRALIEAFLDFPEEDIDFIKDSDAKARLQDILADLTKLLGNARQGKILQSGLNVVLVGKPNVGKSSLMNYFAKEDFAIVSEIAGTTRDTLKSAINLQGIPLNIIDTAGLRDLHQTADEVEKIGIGRTHKEIANADVVIFLQDIFDFQNNENQGENELNIKFPENVPILKVINKIDLCENSADFANSENQNAVFISVKQQIGLQNLEQQLLNLIGWHEDENIFIARERHIIALKKALEFAQNAALLQEPELVAEELRNAQSELAEIVGEITPDDLLDKIFSQFCIGK